MMCLGLMGPNAANTTGGKVLIRSLRRAIQGMPEQELRENLTDIRDRLTAALSTPQTTTVVFDGPTPLPVEWDDASYDLTAFADGD